MIKNLFFSSVACPKTSILILKSLLLQFRLDVDFMNLFWKCLEFCANLCDYEKFEDGKYILDIRLDIPTELMKDVNTIKELALKFVTLYL